MAAMVFAGKFYESHTERIVSHPVRAPVVMRAGVQTEPEISRADAVGR